jgi:hypothetical protein
MSRRTSPGSRATRTALYPVVPGGVKMPSALARVLKATERAVAERGRYQLRGSYSHYYYRQRLGGAGTTRQQDPEGG